MRLGASVVLGPSGVFSKAPSASYNATIRYSIDGHMIATANMGFLSGIDQPSSAFVTPKVPAIEPGKHALTLEVEVLVHPSVTGVPRKQSNMFMVVAAAKRTVKLSLEIVAGSIAIIDTGVDPTHPVLKSVLLTGYDFTRNTSGGSERVDVNASPDTSSGSTGEVNQRTVAVLDQRTVAVLDGTQYSAFGHGTMTAGLVHLVAPQAKILPLKAFHSDGTGYDSDVLRAIYYAVAHGAKVMNMSFDYSTYSPELARAIKYANSKGVVSVASAGNDGQRKVVYPGGLPGVINVASTSNNDIQSTFTNYGAPPVWIAAPGEGVVTTYPWGTYAAGWGTSFSTPLTAGTAALMLGTNGGCRSASIPLGLAAADYIGDIDMGFGRLDTYQSVFACRILH